MITTQYRSREVSSESIYILYVHRTMCRSVQIKSLKTQEMEIVSLKKFTLVCLTYSSNFYRSLLLLSLKTKCRILLLIYSLHLISYSQKSSKSGMVKPSLSSLFSIMKIHDYVLIKLHNEMNGKFI